MYNDGASFNQIKDMKVSIEGTFRAVNTGTGIEISKVGGDECRVATMFEYTIALHRCNITLDHVVELQMFVQWLRENRKDI